MLSCLCPLWGLDRIILNDRSSKYKSIAKWTILREYLKHRQKILSRDSAVKTVLHLRFILWWILRRKLLLMLVPYPVLWLMISFSQWRKISARQSRKWFLGVRAVKMSRKWARGVLSLFLKLRDCSWLRNLRNRVQEGSLTVTKDSIRHWGRWGKSSVARKTSWSTARATSRQ
jgi:hypothetical protein